MPLSGGGAAQRAGFGAMWALGPGFSAEGPYRDDLNRIAQRIITHSTVAPELDTDEFSVNPVVVFAVTQMVSLRFAETATRKLVSGKATGRTTVTVVPDPGKVEVPFCVPRVSNSLAMLVGFPPVSDAKVFTLVPAIRSPGVAPPSSENKSDREVPPVPPPSRNVDPTTLIVPPVLVTAIPPSLPFTALATHAESADRKLDVSRTWPP